MSEKRPVKFRYFNDTRNSLVEGEGSFHKWGSDAELRDDAYYQATFAVIEDTSGIVHRVPENCIQFTDYISD